MKFQIIKPPVLNNLLRIACALIGLCFVSNASAFIFPMNGIANAGPGGELQSGAYLNDMDDPFYWYLDFNLSSGGVVIQGSDTNPTSLSISGNVKAFAFDSITKLPVDIGIDVDLFLDITYQDSSTTIKNDIGLSGNTYFATKDADIIAKLIYKELDNTGSSIIDLDFSVQDESECDISIGCVLELIDHPFLSLDADGNATRDGEFAFLTEIINDEVVSASGFLCHRGLWDISPDPRLCGYNNAPIDEWSHTFVFTVGDFTDMPGDLTVEQIPEPNTVLLMVLGLIGVGAVRRRVM